MTGFLNALMRDVYDGVLSDVYFSYDGKYFPDEVPAGVAVLFICQSKGIPCVLVTAGFHHGKKYQWIHHMLGEMRLPSMTDVGNSEEPEVEAPVKAWARALDYLTKIINRK